MVIISRLYYNLDMPHPKSKTRYIEVNCAQCNVLFTKRSIFLKDKNYCTNKCRGLSARTSITAPCGHCGKETTRMLNQIKKSKRGFIFCTQSCANAHGNQFKGNDAHPNWKGGAASYRNRAIKHYGPNCMSSNCDIRNAGYIVPKDMLDVHHIDFNRKNNTLDNLIVLCVWCHTKITRNIVT
jgi:hypothetical protein